MRRRIGRWLRDLAHRVDPQPPSPSQPGMTHLDFARGEVWRDGKLLSKSKMKRRRVWR